MRLLRISLALASIMVALAVAVRAGLHDETMRPPPQVQDVDRILPARPDSYLGIYAPPAPVSLAGVTSFRTLTGVKPDVLMYYSGWDEPFQASFAADAARAGAVPLIQLDPTKVSLAAIAAGRYDTYLTAYADAVRQYRSAVILSFAHEMNGDWYSWGNGRSSPAQFVAAWRHIVTLFRTAGAENVTWLWTVNVVNLAPGHGAIPSPAAWWPGSAYVTWVGIDGYYLQPSYRFTSLFGPTIAIVRALTSDPVLIAETGAAADASQPAKISDLVAGVRAYGLLGFVWFDALGAEDWRIGSPGSVAAFQSAAAADDRPGG